MNIVLVKALIASLPAGMLLYGAAALFSQARTVPSSLQLIGAASMLLVVVTHVFEGLHLLPWMGWGGPHSVGHYLDASSALLGVTLFPLGYVLHARRRGEAARSGRR